MARAVEYLDIPTNHDIVTNRNLASDRKCGIMPDTDIVADSQDRVIGVAYGKYKTALSVYVYIISDYQLPAALNPVNEWTRMQFAPICGAIGFKKGFTDEHT
jgi:hypothetical protein